MAPQGKTADNILKGKVICACCGGKMQRKRGTGHADWYFFTCITKNRLGGDKCTGMYVQEEDIFCEIYKQLKVYINEKFISGTLHKQRLQELRDQIATLAQHRDEVWNSATKYYEKYVQGEARKEELRAVLDTANQTKADLIQATERKAVYEAKYTRFCKLLSASNRNVPLSEIVDCIDAVVIDSGKKIVVKWNIN